MLKALRGVSGLISKTGTPAVLVVQVSKVQARSVLGRCLLLNSYILELRVHFYWLRRKFWQRWQPWSLAASLMVVMSLVIHYFLLSKLGDSLVGCKFVFVTGVSKAFLMGNHFFLCIYSPFIQLFLLFYFSFSLNFIGVNIRFTVYAW